MQSYYEKNGTLMARNISSDLPPAAVVRVSSATFDPARFAQVKKMADDTGEYLVPAIKKLPGLIDYYAACSPTGSMVHVSIWDNEEHAKQMRHLKEMIVDARRDAEKAGVTFAPDINYPLTWHIEGS